MSGSYIAIIISNKCRKNFFWRITPLTHLTQFALFTYALSATSFYRFIHNIQNLQLNHSYEKHHYNVNNAFKNSNPHIPYFHQITY